MTGEYHMPYNWLLMLYFTVVLMVTRALTPTPWCAQQQQQHHPIGPITQPMSTTMNRPPTVPSGTKRTGQCRTNANESNNGCTDTCTSPVADAIRSYSEPVNTSTNANKPTSAQRQPHPRHQCHQVQQQQQHTNCDTATCTTATVTSPSHPTANLPTIRPQEDG